MKDVVERLRNPMVTYSEGVLLMEEAADEIERLRKQVAMLERHRDELSVQIGKLSLHIAELKNGEDDHG